MIKIVYITQAQKCFSNELKPFEGVLATAGLELWLQKQRMLGTLLKEIGV
jgi:hypothetical protein